MNKTIKKTELFLLVIFSPFFSQAIGVSLLLKFSTEGTLRRKLVFHFNAQEQGNMTTVFITLQRFPVYFKIHLATTARENVASSGKDPVSANLHFKFSCLCCWRQRQLQRYKIRERETKERSSGKFCTNKQKILLMRLYQSELLSGVVFRDFRRYKSYHFLKLI